MTACDLSACTKPWEIQLEIVKVIYQEFYAEVRETSALYLSGLFLFMHGSSAVIYWLSSYSDVLWAHHVFQRTSAHEAIYFGINRTE